jgi:N-acetylglucosaminyl-diphospho-decaprenol L-rhamnosyltransferase
MPARLRVVVITKGSSAVLPGLLGSLPTATTSAYELVVVHNSSVEEPPACPEGTRLLQSSGDLGFGMAVNFAAAGFEGELLVLTDPAVVLGPGSLDGLAAAMGRWPRAGCVGPGSGAEGIATWLPSRLLVVRREAWEQVGGFDPSYLTPGADVDLCHRLGEAGWQSVGVPGVDVRGGEHGSGPVLAERARGRRDMIKARYPAWHQAPVRWVMRTQAP